MGKMMLRSVLIGNLIVTLTGSGGGVQGATNADKPVPRVSAAVQTAAIVSVEADSTAPEIELLSVNGISLSDNRQAVVDKRGVPLTIEKDPFVKGAETYEYGSVSVRFSDGIVESVAVAAEAERFRIDGREIEIRPDQIRKAMGDPDYVAEDGLVYQRRGALLKVYLDTEAGKIVRITYYSISNV